MSSLVVLLSDPEPPPRLGADAVQALAALGVTSVTVLQGDNATAFALEGWAFDPARSAAAAARALAAKPGAVSILHPVLESSIRRLPAAGPERPEP